MNKKLLIAGFTLVAGYFMLSAFGGKTKAQQMEEIKTLVAAKLEELRATKTAECDARVAAEAQTRYDAIVAQREADAAAKPVAGKKTVKKGSGPKVTPLPQPSTPAPSNPKDSKMNQTPNVESKDAKMNQTPNTDKKDAKMNKMKQSGGGK